MYRKSASAGRDLLAMVTASPGPEVDSISRGSHASGCSESVSDSLSFGGCLSSSSNALSQLPSSSLLILYTDTSGLPIKL
jgi:hypothetical protein